MTRSITFPKTADGEWTNRETGVKVTRYGKGYRAFRLADVTTGYIGVCREVSTLAEARHEATRYVANAARTEIARAYVEAVTEHVERAARKAEAAGAPTWRGDVARRVIGYAASGGSIKWLTGAISEVRRLEEWTAEYANMNVATGLCLRTTGVHVGHMKAVTAECREEESGNHEPVDYTDPPRFPEGTPEYEAYRAELRTELGKFARGEDPYPYEFGPKPSDAEPTDPEPPSEWAPEPEQSAEDTVHYWPAADGRSTDKQYGDLSACGVNIMTTPYTFGSPEWDEVTCGQCLTVQPPADEDPRCETCGENLREIERGTLGHIPGDPCAPVDPDERIDITPAGRDYLMATEVIAGSRDVGGMTGAGKTADPVEAFYRVFSPHRH